MKLPAMRIGTRCIGGEHVCSIGLPRLGYSIGAAGATKEDAIHRAAHVAETLVTYLAAHPELAALVSPQAAIALKAIKLVSFAIKAGYAKDAAEAVEHVAATMGDDAASAAHAVAGVFGRIFGDTPQRGRRVDHR